MLRKILHQGSIASTARRTHSRAGPHSTISVPWLAACGFALLFNLESTRDQAAPAAADQSASPENTSIPASPVGVHGQTTKRWYFFKGRPDDEGPDGVNKLLIFGGSVYPELSGDVCKLLGMKEGKISLSRFADGECRVSIEETVMGKDVFLVSPTHTNDSLVEMMLIIATARRASADRITAVIPFYGYSRQDRRFRREPIAAADVAHMLEAMGVDRIITIDLHSGQIQGFFSPTTPVDHLTPMGVAAAYLGELVTEELRTMGGGLEEVDGLDRGDDLPTRIVVVAPQEGQVRVGQDSEGGPLSPCPCPPFISRVGL